MTCTDYQNLVEFFVLTDMHRDRLVQLADFLRGHYENFDREKFLGYYDELIGRGE